jgi:hypothetical protein
VKTSLRRSGPALFACVTLTGCIHPINHTAEVDQGLRVTAAAMELVPRAPANNSRITASRGPGLAMSVGTGRSNILVQFVSPVFTLSPRADTSESLSFHLKDALTGLIVGSALDVYVQLGHRPVDYGFGALLDFAPEVYGMVGRRFMIARDPCVRFGLDAEGDVGFTGKTTTKTVVGGSGTMGLEGNGWRIGALVDARWFSEWPLNCGGSDMYIGSCAGSASVFSAGLVFSGSFTAGDVCAAPSRGRRNR